MLGPVRQEPSGDFPAVAAKGIAPRILDDVYIDPMLKTVAEQVADRLRREILTGRTRPGTRLFQDVEAARFEVSRTPVREAFRQLEAERLIQIVPNRGAIVARLRTKEVREVFLIRAQLEPLAAATAARLAAPDDIEAIGALLEQLEYARKQAQTRSLSELNKEFHFLVYRTSGMSRLVNIIASLWGPIEAMRAVYASEPVTAGHAADEHTRLYQAIRNHDGEAAAAITRQHVQTMASALLALMEGTSPADVEFDGAAEAEALKDGDPGSIDDRERQGAIPKGA